MYRCSVSLCSPIHRFAYICMLIAMTTSSAFCGSCIMTGLVVLVLSYATMVLGTGSDYDEALWGSYILSNV